jgi:hypothetical protein
MRSFKSFPLVLLVLASFIFIHSHPAQAASRKELKQMCRQEFRECKKDNNNAYCRKIKKECRVENKVTFKDDLIYAQEQILKVGKKIADHVQMDLSQDDLGEFITIRFISKKVGDFGDITYIPNGMYSHVVIYNDGKEQKIEFKIYTKDMEQRNIGEELQTSEGRLFPKFINGVKFESLWGQEIGAKNFQVYFDPEKKIVGMFIPSQVAGKLMNWLNQVKNSIKYVKDVIPNINSIPVNIKLEKEKVGRVSILSEDKNQTNAGLVILFDHAKISSILRK